MRRSLLAIPLALAVLASGCTGGASSATQFEGEEQKVAEQVEKLETAGEAADAEEICADILAASLKQQIEEAGSTCEEELDKAIKDADDFDLEVEDVAISGDTATVKVKGQDRGKDQVRTFEFERDGSSWRAKTLG